MLPQLVKKLEKKAPFQRRKQSVASSEDTSAAKISQENLTFPEYELPEDQALEISIGGKPVWHVTPQTNQRAKIKDGNLVIEWPQRVKDVFDGKVIVDVKHNGSLLAHQEFQVGDSSEIFELKNPQGQDLVINKFGKMLKKLDPSDNDFDEILQQTQKLIKVAKEKAGIDLFAIGGTLLGIMRGGQIVPGDDDADVGYMSSHRNITDVILENYNFERVLREEGYEIARYSGGHLQLLFPPGQYGHDFWIDIDAYFSTGGTFYATAQGTAREDEVTLFPLTTGNLIGYELPIPYDSPSLMKATYGSNWEIPDSSFVFRTDPRIARRYLYWLNYIMDDWRTWEDIHKADLLAHLNADHQNESQAEVSDEGSEPALSPASSDIDIPHIPDHEGDDFAYYVRDQISKNYDGAVTVIDLGAGVSTSCEIFAEVGHDVLAVDFSRPAQQWRINHPIERVEPFLANVIDIRDVARLAERISEIEGPIVVYGREWMDNFRWLSYVPMVPLLRQLVQRQIPVYMESFLPELDHRVQRYPGFDFYSRASLTEQKTRLARFGLEPNIIKQVDNRIWYTLQLKTIVL